MGIQPYTVRETRAEPRLIAAVRGVVPFGRVAEYFARYLDQVYAAARAGAIVLDGQNIFVYQHRPDGALTIDFGVGCAHDFEAIADVTPVYTPHGPVATTTHWGAYHLLRAAHESVHAWCRDHQRTLAGPSWEVYGHWTDDPAALRTDVFYLLEEL